MLCLGRRRHESIVIGNCIKVTVLKVHGNSVSLGIEAPPDVKVRRGELPEDGVSKVIKGE